MVRREAPSSARAGWRALVESDGTLHGWLGGSCIEPTVRREALRVLREGRPCTLVFAPEGGGSPGPGAGAGSPSLGGRGPDTLVYPMVCHSGGTVEIFVEPQLPAPILALFGDSPVTRALAAMGPPAGYRVMVVGVGEGTGAYAGVDTYASVETLRLPEDRDVYAVVATMGEWDEDATRQALETGASYVGLVSSPRRAGSVRRTLTEAGVAEEDLDRLVSPAGLDLGAEEPGEIAVTILAELVDLRRRVHPREGPRLAEEGGRSDGPMGPRLVSEEEPAEEGAGDEEAGGVATDPVCGMAVDRERAHHVYTHEGRTYYFCCPHCRERFAREPESFLA